MLEKFLISWFTSCWREVSKQEDKFTMEFFAVYLAPFFVLLAHLEQQCLGQYMTECTRGVKRAHPTQENAYQIFVRTDYSSKWVDYFCPAPEVFDSAQCSCILSFTRATTPTPPTSTPSSTQPPHKSQWFSDSKLLKEYPTQEPGEAHTVVVKRLPVDNHEVSRPPSTSSPKTSDNEVQPPAKRCETHRPGADAHHYMQWTESGWMERDCNWPADAGLVWNQELCRCDWGPHGTQLGRSRVNSVPAVCLLMLKMTFNQGEVKDEGRGLWLDLTHPSSVEAVKDESAIGGWAGAFRGTGLSVPYFKQNTLGATFRIKFRFQLCNGHPDSDLLLVNNGCLESDAMPTLQVSYRAWNRILAFQMETQNSIRPYREECQIASQDRWIDINIHYYNNTLEIFANGVQCVRSSAFAGPIATTDCPLTLLEDNYCGLLDEVVITRGCTPMQES